MTIKIRRNAQQVILVLVMILSWGLIWAGCEHKADKPATTKQQNNKETIKMQLKSNAFAMNAVIPKRYTGEGEDISPELIFSGVPAGTKQLALIMDDPDAPRATPWVHWVIYNISPNTKTLPEHIDQTLHPEQVPGAMQGKNSWPSDNIGYRGPMPPVGHGVHHYHFRLYALDTNLNAKAGIDKQQLLAAMQGHIIEQAELTGTYQR